MKFIARIFEAIANIFRKIVEAIADALKWIMDRIVDFMEGVGKWIAMGVIVGFIVAPALMASIIAGIGAVVKTIGAAVWNAAKWAYANITTTLAFLADKFKAFLEVIHFKELIVLHKMGMILSKDYRDMMNKVYKEISEFAYEVFGTTEMLHLLLQGSRQMIYSMSTAVGYPVDIAEIEWLMSLDETLQKISARAEEYADNPELIFDDIAEWVYTPIGEKYATINQGFILALEGVIKGVDVVAQQVFEINEQTQQVVSYLPEPLRGTLKKTLEPIDRRITTFQYDIYEPKMAELDGALAESQNNVYRNQQEVSGLTRRLISPADYLGELDDLDLNDREREKRKIDITINEPFDSDRAELGAAIDDEIEVEIETKEIIPEPTTAPPKFMELEPEEEKVPVGRQRIGWYVGDY